MRLKIKLLNYSTEYNVSIRLRFSRDFFYTFVDGIKRAKDDFFKINFAFSSNIFFLFRKVNG